MRKEEQTEFEKKVLDQFMSGKNLFGKDGAFAPMLKNVIEKALEAEMEGHLDESQRINGNKREKDHQERLWHFRYRYAPGQAKQL
jgi:hypothetical protein